MIDRARELLGSEWDRIAAEQGTCEHTAAVTAMLHAGSLDNTVELGAIGEAVGIGQDMPVRAAERKGRARRLLASAFERLDRDRGGSMLGAACARAVRSGLWDGHPIIRAIERALAGNIDADPAP